MLGGSQTRIYDPQSSVSFRRTKERYGGLSNMASGFPIAINGIRIPTSEALYQACRYPAKPDIQLLIVGQRSPMTAKMKARRYLKDTRHDWDSVRVEIMRWCLRAKLAQNWDSFGGLLLRTGDAPIVEDSRKDAFWGAKRTGDGELVGTNALGRLLMELREELKGPNSEHLRVVAPPQISDFLLNGQPIGHVACSDGSVSPGEAKVAGGSTDAGTQASMEWDRSSERDGGLGYVEEVGSPNSDEEERSDNLNAGHRRRLIEVAFPLEEVSAHSRREKNVRHGHISTLHIWWARRPLAACRAFIYASLVDDPETDAERDELLKEVADLASWDAVRHPDRVVRAKEDGGSGLTGTDLLKRARRRILDCNGEAPPKLLDPFAGGGAIPLEGLRLGCEVEASDLNPVAVLILKGTCRISAEVRAAGQPASARLHSEGRRERFSVQLCRRRSCRSLPAQPLGDRCALLGQLDAGAYAREELSEFYPPSPDGTVPVAYLWSRTIQCPNCDACDAPDKAILAGSKTQQESGPKASRPSRQQHRGL